MVTMTRANIPIGGQGQGGQGDSTTKHSMDPPTKGYDVQYERLLMQELSLKHDRTKFLQSSVRSAAAALLLLQLNRPMTNSNKLFHLP